MNAFTILVAVVAACFVTFGGVAGFLIGGVTLAAIGYDAAR